MTGIEPGNLGFGSDKPLGKPENRLCQCGKVKMGTSYVRADGYTQIRFVCSKCDRPEDVDGTTEETDPRRLQ